MDNSKPLWPQRLGKFWLGALVLSLILGVSFISLWKSKVANPLEQFYFWRYCWLTLTADGPTLPAAAKVKEYSSVFAGDFLATSAMLAVPPGPITIRKIHLTPEAMRHLLQMNIYNGYTFWGALRYPLAGFFLCFVPLMFFGLRLDRKRNAAARNGRVLRGPNVISRWRFNYEMRREARQRAKDEGRSTKDLDGVSFPLRNRRNLLELWSGETGKNLVIPEDKLAEHLLISGSTGSGKTAVIWNILKYVEAKDDTAVILDPDREYLRSFFKEKRGDWIGNPKDERCFYWDLANEIRDIEDANQIAESFFPEEPTRIKFFLSHSRAILAYLLAAHRPDVRTLIRWLSKPDMLDQLLRGTPHAVAIDPKAPQQRSGILGSMVEIAQALSLLPMSPEGRRVFSVREWATTRQGWIFLSSVPNANTNVKALHSIWIDMIVGTLQSGFAGDKSQRRAWGIFDELAEARKIPKLPTALTKNRKYGNPIVLGFHDKAQLVDTYGENPAKTILGQPSTQVVLRTQEQTAVEDRAEMIGKVELERVNENTSSHAFDRRGSYSSQRVIEPRILASEIRKLPSLEGYVVHGGKVVKARFKAAIRPIVAPDLIERTIPILREEDPPATQPEPEPEPEAAGSNTAKEEISAQPQIVQEISPFA
jgi:type IV secretory pathway TraG/TraD family ATPase VirD4